MSNYSVVRDISQEMRRRIYNALEATPDNDFGLPPIEQAIALEPPGDRISDNTTQLSLFLYHIEVDPYNRNQLRLRIAPDGLLRPPLPLHLHYLVTPLNDSEDDNLLMLGRILQHFHFHPALDSIDGTPIGDSFGGGVSELRILFESLPIANLYTLWNMIESPYRLSLTFSVTPVAIDSDLGVAQGTRVIETHTVVGEIGRNGQS
jgi:hypothetical protein